MSERDGRTLTNEKRCIRIDTGVTNLIWEKICETPALLINSALRRALNGDEFCLLRNCSENNKIFRHFGTSEPGFAFARSGNSRSRSKIWLGRLGYGKRSESSHV